jgi:hypothetical protein
LKKLFEIPNFLATRFVRLVLAGLKIEISKKNLCLYIIVIKMLIYKISPFFQKIFGGSDGGGGG